MGRLDASLLIGRWCVRLTAQLKALYLARGRLGQLGHKLDPARAFILRHFFFAVSDQRRLQFLRRRVAFFQDDKRFRFDQVRRVRVTDHRALQHRRINIEAELIVRLSQSLGVEMDHGGQGLADTLAWETLHVFWIIVSMAVDRVCEYPATPPENLWCCA